jgi:hypothetical protein
LISTELGQPLRSRERVSQRQTTAHGLADERHGGEAKLVEQRVDVGGVRF